MEFKVSIVVPTYGRFNSFVKLINSVSNSRILKENYEIVIVSSDSEDSEKIKWINDNKSIDIKLFCEADRKTVRNRSLYYYENIGIKNSKYEWILVCNDDMWFEPDWYENFIKQIDSNKVYLIASHVGYSDELRIPDIGTITKDNIVETMWLYDMSIIHRSIYEKINFLDENIHWYGKGADLSLSIAFLTNEKAKLCYDVKINHDISHENRVSNISTTPNGDDFIYIKNKWNKWIVDNNKNYSYNWL